MAGRVGYESAQERERALQVLAYLMEDDDDYEDEKLYELVTPLAPGAMVASPAVLMLDPNVKAKVVDEDLIIDRGETEIIAPLYEIEAYYSSQMYLNAPERDDFGYKMKCDLRLRTDIQIPHLNKVVDGQLKIMTDYILIIDYYVTMLLKPKADVKILVLGSASEAGKCSVSYQIIELMRIPANITLDLYDPYELVRQNIFRHQIDSVPYTIVYNYHREKFIYSDEALVPYDIVLDDIFDPSLLDTDSQRLKVDPTKSLLRSKKCYSAKFLTNDFEYMMPGSYIYRQAFPTHAHEARLTSYHRKYTRYHRSILGSCAGCAELSYMLFRDYSDEFYKKYLESHKAACVAGYRHRASDIVYDHCISAPRSRFDILVCKEHNSYRNLYVYDRVSYFSVDCAYPLDKAPDITHYFRKPLLFPSELDLSPTTVPSDRKVIVQDVLAYALMSLPMIVFDVVNINRVITTYRVEGIENFQEVYQFEIHYRRIPTIKPFVIEKKKDTDFFEPIKALDRMDIISRISKKDEPRDFKGPYKKH